MAGFMTKKRTKKYTPKPASARAIFAIINAHSHADQEPSIHESIALEAYQCIERLAKGLFDLNDFITVNRLNSLAYELAMQIKPTLDESSQQAIMQHIHTMHTCADHLVEIGERYAKSGKWGATGDQLNAIRDSVSLLDSMLAAATVGQTVQAIKRADSLVNNLLRSFK